MYAPVIKSARRVREHGLGPDLRAVLFTDVEAPPGGIEYAHVMVIFRNGRQDPAAFITSELNDGSSGSHFLCAFVGGAHRNYGAADAWGDLAAFEKAALERAAQLRDAGDLGGAGAA